MSDSPFDTDARAAARWRRLIDSLDGERRVQLATEMFTMARELAEAGVRSEGSGLAASELMARTFERLYQTGLDAETRSLVAIRIRRSGRPASR